MKRTSSDVLGYGKRSPINKAALIGDLAVCLEDCLVRIFPEEFKQPSIYEAGRRFSKAGGTIARISGLVDKAKETI